MFFGKTGYDENSISDLGHVVTVIESPYSKPIIEKIAKNLCVSAKEIKIDYVNQALTYHNDDIYDVLNHVETFSKAFVVNFESNAIFVAIFVVNETIDLYVLTPSEAGIVKNALDNKLDEIDLGWIIIHAS